MQRKKAERRGERNSKQHVGRSEILSKKERKKKAEVFRPCGFLQVGKSSLNSTRHAAAWQTQITLLLQIEAQKRNSG